MKIYNEELTEILDIENLDLKNGCILEKEKEVEYPEQPEVKEVGHYKEIATYPNGGKDVEYIVDVPGCDWVASYIRIEKVKYYHPYTQNEKIKLEIRRLKAEMAETDEIVLSYTEGAILFSEYEPVKNKRAQLRAKIKELEGQLE